MDSTIRITSHGKLKSWVSYALNFLSKNEEIPLVFHSLPPIDSSSHANKKSPATTTIPRLISTIEIIKREFVKSLEAKHSTRLIGLHQYNEIRCLEDIPEYAKLDSEESRTQSIVRALEGKKYPRQEQTPYMRITLSLRELPELVVKGATYQKPIARQLSKGQKNRAKKRARKSAQESSSPTNPQANTPIGS